MSTVIAIAVIEHRGRFLVGVRPEGVRLAGYHEFPGGKLLPGESPEAAAVRESLEETGLAVEPVARLQSVDDAAAKLQLHFIACRIQGEAGEPNAPFRWIARNELGQCRFPPANALVVEQLLRQADSP
jgi:8-oxo-dGTP diphosphatase